MVAIVSDITHLVLRQGRNCGLPVQIYRINQRAGDTETKNKNVSLSIENNLYLNNVNPAIQITHSKTLAKAIHFTTLAILF